MENLLIAILAAVVIGFGLVIFFFTKLLKEQRTTNQNIDSNLSALSEIKSALNDLEKVISEHKSLSQSGLAQIENALKETIKLD